MLFVLGIGTYASKYTKTVGDFFLANRRLGVLATSLSSVASSESGWVVLGLVGMAYKFGMSVVWIVPGCLLGYVANWYFIASKLRRNSKSLDALTIPDFLENRFRDASHIIRIVAVVVIFFCMMGYVGAQFNATGKTFNAVFGMSYLGGVFLGAGITIIYTILGGFRAVSWTDVVQGLLMVAGLVILPLIAILNIGGLGILIYKLGELNPSFLTLSGENAGFALIGMVIGYLGIGLGYPGQPHVITRYMAAKGEKEIRMGRVIAIVWGVLVYYGAIFLGLAGRVMIPHIADPEYTFPQVTLRLVPPAIAGIMLAAIMAAIHSTADSQLLVASSAIARDIYQKVFKRQISERRIVIISRLTVLVLGLLSLALAATKSRVIFWFVLFAWSGLGASFGPLIILSMYWKRVTKWGAVAGMIIGFATTVIWKLSGLSEKITYELVPAFFFALIGIFIISLLTKQFQRRETEN